MYYVKKREALRLKPILNNDRSNGIETNSGQITFIVTSLL